MRDHCESCGIRFEREPGYWVGAITLNTTAAFVGFVVLFAGLTVATWPVVPWGLVSAVTVSVNLALPILFYPISKTLWVALELSWHPMEDEELRSARERIAS